MNTLNGICSNCQSKKHNLFYSPENKVLPTWKSKKGVVKYTIPPQLQHLTLAEKLLIQRVSPLIPMIHIKNKWNTRFQRTCCQFFSGYNKHLFRTT
jgi:hypothetical protein